MVALAGPPPVNRYGSRKTWAVPDLAHEHRGDQWDRIADHQGEGGEVTGVLHRGEQQRIVEHVAEVGHPTQLGAETRLVDWKLITTERRIGHHEKTPKITRRGRANSSVLPPPERHQVTGLCRRSRVAGGVVGGEEFGSVRELRCSFRVVMSDPIDSSS